MARLARDIYRAALHPRDLIDGPTGERFIEQGSIVK